MLGRRGITAMWLEAGLHDADLVWCLKSMPMTHSLGTYRDLREQHCFHFVVELSRKYVHAFGLLVKLVHALLLLPNLQWPPKASGLKFKLLNIADGDIHNARVVFSLPPFSAPVSSSPTIVLSMFGCPSREASSLSYLHSFARDAL